MVEMVMSFTHEVFNERLKTIEESQGQQQVQINGYKLLMKDIRLNALECDLLPMSEKIIEILVDENLSLLISQPVLNEYVSKIIPTFKCEQGMHLAHFILDKISHRISSFEELATSTYLYLSESYEKKRNFKQAVHMLVSIPLESGLKIFTLDYKLKMYIKIINHYLEDNNLPQAALYLNRASILQNLTDNKYLQTCYKAYYARLLDVRHSFIQAAYIYVELSHATNLTEDERITSVRSALSCTIISSPGVKRSELLQKLFKDNRSQKWLSYSILKKMHLCHMIQPDEIEEIKKILLKHHLKIITEYKTPLFSEAIIEHNIISISKLYKNIRIQSLGDLLKIDRYKAEKVAGKMISEECMEGSIDQIDGFIYFRYNMPQCERHTNALIYNG
ncbi:COP9 signalosome complex subunit 4-like [Melanaphis sacchari]|uniref:COP9 signalosome complex subunit 4-like n=1 Tax=Melanaphis sacchari TaxID=742174 RepID=UPI000DC14DE0|nr:COP9 signalosome complex subunit 4-like [Melanaphis sacchari]